MGGDHGPAVTVPAALDFLALRIPSAARHPGRPRRRTSAPQLAQACARRRRSARCASGTPPRSSRWTRRPRSRCAARRIRRCASAIDLVKDGDAQACVSAGNTGALMATAHFVLKTLPGIDRPAIATRAADAQRAHHDARPRRQRRLHRRASAAVRRHGQRAGRGRREQAAADASGCSTSARKRSRATTSSRRRPSCCKASDLNFYGNIEGDDIYRGTVDVVVCDGFVGNVALKTSEGLAQMLGAVPARRIQAQPADEGWRAVRAAGASSASSDRVDHRRYNGASLIGLKGIVMKSHGVGRPPGVRDSRSDARTTRRRTACSAGSPRWLAAHRRHDAGRPHDAPRCTAARADAMPNRITGTGELSARRRSSPTTISRSVVETTDEWIVCAHRHPPAPHRGRRRVDQRPRAAGVARGARGGRARAGGHRPDHRRHDDAGHGLPEHRVPSCRPSSASHGGPAFDVQAVCSGFVYALAIADQHAAPAGRIATRWSSAPRSIRASSTGTIAAPACCSATAPARSCCRKRPTPGHPRVAPARRRPLRGHPLRARRRVDAARSAATRCCKMDGQGGVQVRGAGAGRGRATRRSPTPG